MAEKKSQKGADGTVMKRKIYQQLLDWKEKRNFPTVLHAVYYKVVDGITYLPLYMTHLIVSTRSKGLKDYQYFKKPQP